MRFILAARDRKRDDTIGYLEHYPKPYFHSLPRAHSEERIFVIVKNDSIISSVLFSAENEILASYEWPIE